MKKAAIALAVLLSVIGKANAKTIVISKYNPSSGGTYNSVKDDHDGTTDTHVLACMNPGVAACAWTQSPWFPERLDDVNHLVTSKLEAGVLSGKEDVGDATVTWTAENTTDYTITIEVK